MVCWWNFDRHPRFVYQAHGYVFYHDGYSPGDGDHPYSLFLPDVCQVETQQLNHET